MYGCADMEIPVDDVVTDSVNVVLEHFTTYVEYLVSLISTRTVTSSAEDVHKGVQLCKRHFEKHLGPHAWTVQIDAMGNLQCIPPIGQIDDSKPMLWLCAHVDTVPANRDEWHEQFDPFTCHESELYLTGRGANDCKAGVAFMLWYAELMSKSRLPAFNGGFLVTCHEEAGAPVPRTAPQYAHDFESGRLPMSTCPSATFLLCLENTVSLGKESEPANAPTWPEIGIYNRESHSFVLKVIGSMEQLRSALKALDDPDWKTVAVWPVNRRGQRVEADHAPVFGSGLQLKKLWQEGGHSCTVRNRDNRIHALVMGVEQDCCFDQSDEAGEKVDFASILAWSGHELETSKVSSVVIVGKIPADVPTPQHAMVLNYRGLAPVAAVMEQVESIRSHVCSVEWLSDKSEGVGAEQAFFLERSIMQFKLNSHDAFRRKSN